MNCQFVHFHTISHTNIPLVGDYTKVYRISFTNLLSVSVEHIPDIWKSQTNFYSVYSTHISLFFFYHMNMYDMISSQQVLPYFQARGHHPLFSCHFIDICTTFGSVPGGTDVINRSSHSMDVCTQLPDIFSSLSHGS